MPLVIVGMPTPSTKRRAATSAPSAHTSVPRISTGRVAPREQSGDPRRARRRRARRRGRAAGAAPRPAAESKNSSIGTSTKTGPRCEEPAARNASSMPPSTSPAVCRVRASFETEATIGGWSSSWRLPLPQRLAGARPPTTTIGEPGELGLGDRADAVGDAGPGGEHREPGHPGQLAGGLGGERRGLLVADVEQPHRWVGLHRAVVHREDVSAREREHRLDAVGARRRRRRAVPACPLRLGRWSLVVRHAPNVTQGPQAGSRVPRKWRVGRAQGVDQHEQQVRAHRGRLGPSASWR